MTASEATGKTAGTALGFDVAGGSVTGSHHAAAGRNNQDAFFWLSSGQRWAGVVCDGCGSAPHSEVGAKLGARAVVQTLLGMLEEQLSPGSPEFWTQLKARLLDWLRGLAESLGGPAAPAVSGYLLFTIVGAIIDSEACSVFSLGDGLAVVNGDRIRIGPFANNAPPYLAYGLDRGVSDLETFESREGASAQPSLGAGASSPRPPALARSEATVLGLDRDPQAFVIHRTLPAARVESLLLGTDGVCELSAAAELPLPGRAEPLGSLEQFWTQDRFFENSDAVRRRLALAARPSQSRVAGGQRSAGLLPDDTTLIVLRRRGGVLS